MSALILPQHASDRQMIEKEAGRRREEGVCVLIASVLKAEQELQ